MKPYGEKPGCYRGEPQRFSKARARILRKPKRCARQTSKNEIRKEQADLSKKKLS